MLLFGTEDFEYYDENGSEGYEHGIYAVFLNVRDPEIQDFGGNPWDDIYGEKWVVYDEEGNPVDSFTDEIMAKRYAEEKAGETGETYSYEESSFVETIDDYVRDIRMHGSGQDGVYAKNIYDGGHEMTEANEWIVFSPNQIKAATDNVDTFDANDNDIRYQRAGGNGPAVAREAYDRMVASAVHQFSEAMQDSMQSLKDLMQAVYEAEGRTFNIADIPNFENAYLAENLTPFETKLTHHLLKTIGTHIELSAHRPCDENSTKKQNWNGLSSADRDVCSFFFDNWNICSNFATRFLDTRYAKYATNRR